MGKQWSFAELSLVGYTRLDLSIALGAPVLRHQRPGTWFGSPSWTMGRYGPWSLARGQDYGFTDGLELRRLQERLGRLLPLLLLRKSAQNHSG